MTVHIAIACDQNYLGSFYALLESIIENCKKVQLHLILTGIDDPQLEGIKRHTSKRGILTTFYNISDGRVHSFVTRDTWTTAVYYRLYFPLLVDAEVERLLYLDTDTIVMKDLSDLFQLPLNGYPLAATYDNYVKIQPLIGIDTPGNYFNSGVLLIDVLKWRERQVSERAMEYLIRHPERIRYVDQCALNAVLKDSWLHLDSTYNCLYSYLPQEFSSVQVRKILSEVVVIHFNLERPWLMLCKNRLRTQYRRYLGKSVLYKGKTVVDFSVRKLPLWLRLRAIEYYTDHVWLQSIWRKLKFSAT